MPQQTKIFRVFVSSTFTDMKEERHLLQKNVFPKLEKYCLENNAKFQAVDLRWGVTEESSLNQKTLDICLNEIVRCQKLSPKPNFLVLLGDKYGWQPIPSKIPGNEINLISNQLDEDEKEILNTWYIMDTNAIPANYVLQPRGEEYADFEVWEELESKIRNILRKVVNQLSLPQKEKNKYFTSATHQEILAGALHENENLESPEQHVLAIVRDIKNLPDDASARDFIDIKNGKPDPECQEQIQKLKTKLTEKLGSNYMPYNATWKDNCSVMDNSQKFEDDIYNFFKGVIQEQLEQIISPDEIDHEILLHRDFKKGLNEHFYGRNEMLQKIKQYRVSSQKQILCMIGESGSGKSSVMARAVSETENENKNALVVFRFIGTSSASSNIISLLQSISGQIAREYDTTLEQLIGEGNEKNLYDMNGITEVFRKCQELSTPEKPIFIYLDALDQLNDSDNAKALYWLPTELPEHTRIIISSLPELESQLSSHKVEHLEVLPVPEAQQILRRWFDSVHRTLTKEQYEELLTKFEKTKLPIYLKLAFEMAKNWHSYKADYNLKDDVEGIINGFIDALGEDHNAEFIQDAICLMLCGRYQGLAEDEILEIFAFDDELWQKFLESTHPEHRQELVDMKKELNGSMKIPIVVWSRLYNDLEPYLTERDADGVPIITFFHRQFNEVLGKRYGLIEKVKA